MAASCWRHPPQVYGMKGAPFLGWRTLRDEVLPAAPVALVGLGQPLLDIIADVDPAYLQVSPGRVCHHVPISTERAQRCIRS